MSEKTDYQAEGAKARRPFAEELKRVFCKIGITTEDYKALGVEIAKAQNPPRHIPYHYKTIQGWLNGELLPTDLAMAAMGKALGARCSDAALAEKTTLYFTEGAITHMLEVAQEREMQLGFKPTELSHALKLTADTCMPSIRALSKHTKAVSEKGPGFYIPHSTGAISMTLNGKIVSSPRKSLTYTLQSVQEDYLKNHPSDMDALPSLTALHEQALRERGDIIWLHAQDDLGSMIKAIRMRLGQSQDAFRQHILPDAPTESDSGIVVHYWETNEHLPMGVAGGTPNGHKSLCEDFIAIAKTIDHAPNRLSRSIAEPWFDADKEKTFRRVFNQRIADFYRDVEPVSRELSPAPDMRLARPEHKVTDARLTRLLLEGGAYKS